MDLKYFIHMLRRGLRHHVHFVSFLLNETNHAKRHVKFYSGPFIVPISARARMRRLISTVISSQCLHLSLPYPRDSDPLNFRPPVPKILTLSGSLKYQLLGPGSAVLVSRECLRSGRESYDVIREHILSRMYEPYQE